jgi:hypothetical protein
MTAVDLVLDWARAFGLTLVVELLVVVPFLSRHVTARWRRLALVTFAQLVSHPVLWFVLPALLPAGAAFLVTAECWAWLAEALLYSAAVPSLGPRTSLVIAFAANAASLTAGLVLRALGVHV